GYAPWGYLWRYPTSACVDDTNWSQSAGNRMQIYACQGGVGGLSNTNQEWREISGPLNFPVTLLQNLTSGMCLDVQGDSHNNNTPAIQWPCNFADSAQQWNIT